ncbi:MAG: hypothetical protein B0A82_09580 [Alkalinema sp. CACIAM 70d]|nr:MAG: hypothetical protein B0A82_09580 [Alkalinema sp. CACIAM 70d]
MKRSSLRPLNTATVCTLSLLATCELPQAAQAAQMPSEVTPSSFEANQLMPISAPSSKVVTIAAPETTVMPEKTASPTLSEPISSLQSLSAVPEAARSETAQQPVAATELQADQAEIPTGASGAADALSPTSASDLGTATTNPTSPVIAATGETSTGEVAKVEVSGPVKIEVDTQGIPPVTELPPRVSLPSKSLLPANFEFPAQLGQAVDRTLTSSTPITDQAGVSATAANLSPRLMVLMKFLKTVPPEINIPCTRFQSTDCSPVVGRADYFSEPGLSLLQEAPNVIPQVPANTAPLARRRLRMTIEELQQLEQQHGQSLQAWAGRIQQCLTEKPKLYVLRSDGAQLPVYFDGKEGTIVRNGEGRAVCPG